MSIPENGSFRHAINRARITFGEDIQSAKGISSIVASKIFPFIINAKPYNEAKFPGYLLNAIEKQNTIITFSAYTIQPAAYLENPSKAIPSTSPILRIMYDTANQNPVGISTSAFNSSQYTADRIYAELGFPEKIPYYPYFNPNINSTYAEIFNYTEELIKAFRDITQGGIFTDQTITIKGIDDISGLPKNIAALINRARTQV